MSLTKRVERLEQEHSAAVGAARKRLFSQLTDEELEALAGPAEAWAGLTDAEVLAVGKGLRPAPPGVAAYEPPPEALLRLWELATPEERRLLELPGPGSGFEQNRQGGQGGQAGNAS